MIRPSFFIAILALVVSLSDSKIVSAQAAWSEYVYTTFSGVEYDSWAIQGDHHVLLVDKTLMTDDMLADASAITSIAEKIDGFYEYYFSVFLAEPSGGNPDFGNKANVFFGSPSCGAACGLVGAKGVEIGGTYWETTFLETKHTLNTHFLGLVAYEFGRNFLIDVGNIFVDPGPENTKNGGWAEGIAAVIGIKANVFNPRIPIQGDFQETTRNLEWFALKYHGYINDPGANPYNSWYNWDFLTPRDPSRGWNGANAEFTTYPSDGIFWGIIEEIGQENFFPGFFNEVRALSRPTTVSQALSNIAVAASRADGKNWMPYFKNVLKFNITQDAESAVSQLPLPVSKLISDEQTLWFTSPLDSLNILLRSTTQNAKNHTFELYLDNELWSSNSHGDNTLTFPNLGGKRQVEALAVLLDSDSNELDRRSFLIRVRDRVTPDDVSWYKMNGEHYRTHKDGTTYTSTAYGDSVGWVYLFSNMVFERTRKYRISGRVRHDGGDIGRDSTWSLLLVGTPHASHGSNQRVGRDIGYGEPNTFFDLSGVIPGTLMVSPEHRYFMGQWGFVSVRGRSSSFTDIVLEDITDLDGDGIIDFEDSDPLNQNRSPIAALSASSVGGQAPHVIEFSASGSSDPDGDGLSYSWSFGDESTAQGSSVSHTYTSAGEFLVVMTASDGYLIDSDSTMITVASGVATEAIELPETFQLRPAYPNPFNLTTTLTYGLPEASDVRITVTDLLGRQLTSVLGGEVKSAGYHTVQLDAGSLASGTYLIRMEAGSFVQTRQVVLLK